MIVEKSKQTNSNYTVIPKTPFVPVKTGFYISIGILMILVGTMVGCASMRPSIKPSLIHPDTDKIITFNASRGEVRGTITQMQIRIGTAIVATAPGETASHTGGPYAPFSNSKLNFAAIATISGGSTKVGANWVYIANPKGVYTYPSPNGSDDGYPASTNEQTGANLYRLDKPVVRSHAMNAVMEYANDQGTTVGNILGTADNMVAAIAWYVDRHMSWRQDDIRDTDPPNIDTNRTVFADNGFGDYDPGWDFPQPADLTLTISGNLTDSDPSNDFMGDCEDHAILRAALLRALGFAPWAIWDAINFDENLGRLTHEYNIVLYEGAFRLMDFGTINRYLNTYDGEWHRSRYGWNEDHGPRFPDTIQHDYLINNTDNYPGGKSDGHDWSHLIYFKNTSP